MPRLDLIDLELLVAVAEAGTFTRGAQRMHMTLASASERIRLLEQRLEVRLFERQPRGVVPTAAGRRLIVHARGIVDRVAGMQAELAQMRTDGSGISLRLWGNTAASSEWVPTRLAVFLRGYPQVDVEVAERASSDIAAALRSGRCDIGVLSDAADSEGLHCVPVRADPLDLILPRRHPLAARRRLALNSIVDEDWVGLAQDTPLQRWVEGHAHADGCRPAYRLRVGTLDEVCRMVGEGVGLAIVPRATAMRRRRGGFARIALDVAWAQRGLQVCVRDPDVCGSAARALFAGLAGQGQSSDSR